MNTIPYSQVINKTDFQTARPIFTTYYQNELINVTYSQVITKTDFQTARFVLFTYNQTGLIEVEITICPPSLELIYYDLFHSLLIPIFIDISPSADFCSFKMTFYYSYICS